MEYYTKALNNYSNFSGRATRSEYWYFALFNIIVMVILSTLMAVTKQSDNSSSVLGSILSGIYGLYSLAIILPSLALVVRRLHDTGNSGLKYLLVLIPIIGALWILYLLVTDSQPGTNAYGPNPKEMMTPVV